MKNIFIILIYILIIPTVLKANTENERLLKELDKVISNKKYYHNLREEKLSQLKDSLKRSNDITEKYNISGALFYEYLHYQADSSLYYINMKHKYFPLLNNPELEDEILINRAEVFGVMGMYNEAKSELDKVNKANITNKGLLGYYYRTRRAYYGWLADYTADDNASKCYSLKTEIYRDSISQLGITDIDFKINQAERMIYDGDYRNAIKALLPLLSDSINLKRKVYVNYTLSDAYEAIGDTPNQIKYLANTAIMDIKMAEREYASLQKLALLMYHQGNLDSCHVLWKMR